MKQPFTPSQKVLDNYADVLVNFALNDCKGIKKGDTVKLMASECARPLYIACYKKIIDKGAHVIHDYRLDGTGDDDVLQYFFHQATKAQLEYFPEKYMKGLVDEADHFLTIIADADPLALQHVDPKKVLTKQRTMMKVHEWLDKKENAGKFSWCGALYGTPAMADQAGLSQKEYWGQITKACFLDSDDPIGDWKAVIKELERTTKKLNKLTPSIEKLHILGPDVDLWITPGEKRQWVAGRGRNIPSFEVFTSPDWRGTEGWINFNQPLYRNGTLMKDVKLVFKEGKVVKSSASRGQSALRNMIKQPNANKVGEFSLTDRRLSRITKFMAHTLYDENVGGKYGNTHIALGRSYDITYTGDAAKLKPKDWEALGYNNSSVHTDIISTTRRTVTAHMKDGKEKMIYKDGEFVI